MTREEAITILSDIRSQYNCFDEAEQTYYHALSMGIQALQEQKVGKWIEHPTAHRDFNLWVCSECGNEIDGHNKSAYCCECGAKMEGADNE